jgi:acetylornithine deacetylase
MFGRGTSDTKGSGAAMLWALTQYASESPPSNNVAIVYTVDEEVGKTGVRAFVKRHLSGLGWKPAGVIVGEPTLSRPVVAHNGVVRWRISTRGIAAHSCDPGQGRSAIAMMTDVIRAIESEYIPNLTAAHPLTGKAQCSINVIRGGVQVNIVPEHCEIRVDRRLVPGENPDTVLPAVERILDELRRANPQLSVSQDSPDMVDHPLDPEGSEGFTSRVLDALKGIGLPAEPHGVGFGTDASSFSVAGVPAVVLGPGDIAQAHTADEWLELEQLRLASEIYLSIMRSPLETGRNDHGTEEG